MPRKKPAVAAAQPAASPSPARSISIPPRYALPAALLFIGVAIARIVSTYHVFASTSDEPAHIACGLEYLANHQYRFESQHPPLARAFVALLPYLSGTRPRGKPTFQLEGWDLITYENHPDLTMTRIDIESLCLARSIENGGVDWETAIVGAMHRLSKTAYWAPGDERRLSEEWVSAHNAFHEALVSACDSVWRLRIRSSLYHQSERYRRLSVPVLSRKRDVDVEHRAISEAALARKKTRACDLLKEHLVLTMNIIIKGLPLEPELNER